MYKVHSPRPPPFSKQNLDLPCLPPLQIHMGMGIFALSVVSSPEVGKGCLITCHEGDLKSAVNDQQGRNTVLWIHRLCDPHSPTAVPCRFATKD